MTYSTEFYLSDNVLDVNEANEYLQEDKMVNYFLRDHPDMDFVESIVWKLINFQRGYITVETTKELTEMEKAIISDWIAGQCSDGLGEGFEQQSFAFYSQGDYDRAHGLNVSYEDDEGDAMTMCSFLDSPNDYKLTKND